MAQVLEFLPHVWKREMEILALVVVIWGSEVAHEKPVSVFLLPNGINRYVFKVSGKFTLS